jgi:hypothetical protein
MVRDWRDPREDKASQGPDYVRFISICGNGRILVLCKNSIGIGITNHRRQLDYQLGGISPSIFVM